MGGDRDDLTLAAQIASITAEASNLEQLSRPLLELLEELTGFESTYVTVLHWDDFKQEVRFARNTGDIAVTEGVFVEWSDTLCRRALFEGRLATDDVPSVWGDSEAAREMEIVTYVSVPIVTVAGSTFGTLCAASARSVQLGDDNRRLMELFARLLADQVERERHAGRERDRVAVAALHAQANAAAIASSEHKLKTPLTVIRGAASQLLGDTVHSDDERRSLLDARGQSALLEATVHDLLVQCQRTGPSPELSLTTVALEPLLVRIVSDMRLVSAGRPITLTCDDRLDCQANDTALLHVLQHLLDNAIKYTPVGSPIEVAAHAGDDVVVITVSDDGDGMPADDVFAPFTRGAGRGDVDGTGLGLYIVRSLVESMGGSVVPERSDSGGARMRVELPPPLDPASY